MYFDENDDMNDERPNVNFNAYEHWPFPHYTVDDHTAGIYESVRQSGQPNHRRAKIILPTTLNTQVWSELSTGHDDDEMIINGIRYGFPIQYTGGPVYGSNVTDNHGSAVRYPTQVQDYLESETKIGALSGPYEAPPFTPWCVVSPLMTREKSEVGKRRIIVDLSFPDGGINKQITKNTFDGKGVGHSLPTIMSAVNTINEMGHTDIWLSVIDLSRAYRHFAVCPLDWPLLGIKEEGKYYFDKSLPFGARMSSYVMQTIAAFIVRALKRRNIVAHMYLDDVILISQTKEKAERDHNVTRTMLQSMGLKIAETKVQQPAHKVTWLGIDIDTHNNSLSIPEPKLEHIKSCLAQASTLKTLTLKQLQRVIGVVNHLSKVVHPARLFVGRLLAAMRNTGAGHIPVSSGMRADLAWFRRFLSSYNGRAILPNDRLVKSVWADACLEGAGATDGKRYYAYRFPGKVTSTHDIVHLEAMNCVAAARDFASHADAGGIIHIYCDN